MKNWKMKNCSTRWMLVLTSVFALASLVCAQDGALATIKGRVVNEAGEGIENIKIATYWTGFGVEELTAFDPATTDADGRFEHGFRVFRFPTVLIAMDHEKNLGGTILIEKDPGDGVVEVVVRPLSRLSFKLKFDGPKQSCSVSMRSRDGKHVYGMLNIIQGDYEFAFPSGEYQLTFSGFTIYIETQNVTLTTGSQVVFDEPEILVTGLGKSIGSQALPLTFADSRGVDEDFKLTDLKGKWVLIEFWGYW
ncbi:MAG: hypothetical protein IH945_03990 [Armatimonadetes bacterium]|nr:hypothetical protein [Armatimonadota bacterium]